MELSKETKNLYKNVTFSMSRNLHKKIKFFIGAGNMSKFVSEAIIEKVNNLEKRLIADCKEATNDKKREEECKLWSILEKEGWYEKS
ncbi:MAG: hypothetical protein LBF97_06885 [Elusimicrobiota bacterium]|jgi:hypothetical protein|nr:hypothetical protein [Elusimicrobiota bacterium]